jgi:hypothetical protein
MAMDHRLVASGCGIGKMINSFDFESIAGNGRFTKECLACEFFR